MVVNTFDDEVVRLRRRIRALLHVYGVPVLALARECGVSPLTLTTTMEGRRGRMELDSLQKMQTGLDRVLRERLSLLKSITGGREL